MNAGDEHGAYGQITWLQTVSAYCPEYSGIAAERNDSTYVDGLGVWGCEGWRCLIDMSRRTGEVGWGGPYFLKLSPTEQKPLIHTLILVVPMAPRGYIWLHGNPSGPTWIHGSMPPSTSTPLPVPMLFPARTLLYRNH